MGNVPDPHARKVCGSRYIVDLTIGTVVHAHINLEQFAHRVCEPWESVCAAPAQH